MPVVQVSLPFSLAGSGPMAVLPFNLERSSTDHAIMPTLPFTLSGDVAAAVLPGQGNAQAVSWSASIGAVALDGYLVGPIQVERSRGSLASFSLQVYIGADAPAIPPALLQILETDCGPAAMEEADISIALLVNGARYTFPVVDGGIVHQTSESYGSDGRLQTFEGLGPGGRWDALTVDYQLPAGTNRYRGVVVQEILRAAGYTGRLSIANGGRTTKRIEATEADPFELCNRILEPDLRRLHFDKAGDLTTIPLGRSGEGVVITYGPQDIVTGTARLGVTITNDGPTLVITTTDAQPTEDAESGCSRKTETVTTEFFQVYTPAEASFTQDSSGTLAARSSTQTAAQRLVRRETVITVTECETVVYEELITEAWHRGPETWRYRVNGTPTGLDGSGNYANYQAGVYIDDATATKNDQAAAYLWPVERFVETRREVRNHEFDERDYNTRSTVKVWGWDIREASLKTRTFGADWDAINYTAAQPILGNGKGLRNFQQESTGSYFGVTGSFFPEGVEQREIVRTLTDDDPEDPEQGFITQEVESVFRWAAQEGEGYLYAGDETRGEDYQAFQLVETVSRAFVRRGDSSRELVITRDELTGEEEVRDEQSRTGYLPAAAKLLDPVPDASNYGEGEDSDDAVAALQEQTQPLKAQYDVFYDATACRTPNTLRYRVEFAEDLEELEAFAEYLAEKSRVKTVNLTVAANPLLSEASVIHVTYPPAKLDHDLEVVSIRHLRDRPGGPVLTEITGEVWP